MMKSSEMNDEMRLAYEIAIDSIYESADVWWCGEEDWFEEVDPESPVAGSESEEE